MKIGVIGVGEIGGTLAKRWSARGHSVTVANSRGKLAVEEFASDVGASAADIYGAVDGAEVVVLSIPFPAVASLPKDLFDGVGNAVIVDTANYYPEVRDARIPEIDAGMTESIWVARQIGRPIIKTFNSILFYSLSELGKPEGQADRLAIPVAGDDAAAKQIIMGLVDEMGFDSVDGGSLQGSWRQQPSTPAYCCDYDATVTRKGIEAAVKGKAERLRDTQWREQYKNLFANNPAYADVHSAVVALNRSLNPL